MNLAILTALPKEHAAVRRLLQNAAPISIPGDTTLYTSGTIPGLGGNQEPLGGRCSLIN